MTTTTVVSLVQRALQKDLRGAWRLYRWIAPRHAPFRRVALRAFSDQPLLIDVSKRDNWAFTKSPDELRAREPELAAAIQELITPTAVVYDIGANIGLCVDLLRSIVDARGAIEAFEPNPALVPALMDSFVSNPNIRVHAIGLAEQSGTLPFYVPQDESMASLGNWRAGDGPVDVTQVPVSRLDDVVTRLQLRYPEFMKVDVEGAEARVFGGAPLLLDRPDAPIIWFEHLQGAAEAQGLAQMAAIETLRSYTKASFTFWSPDEEIGLRQFDVPPRRWCEIMAVPRSRADAAPRIATRLAAMTRNSL